MLNLYTEALKEGVMRQELLDELYRKIRLYGEQEQTNILMEFIMKTDLVNMFLEFLAKRELKC